jgi:hypothetical protein
MKPFDDPLDRLLRSAAQSPPRVLGALPFATETRVLTGWRSEQSEDSSLGLLHLFRRGLALAGALAALTVAVSLWEMSRSAKDVWAVSDTVINVASIQ